MLLKLYEVEVETDLGAIVLFKVAAKSSKRAIAAIISTLPDMYLKDISARVIGVIEREEKLNG